MQIVRKLGTFPKLKVVWAVYLFYSIPFVIAWCSWGTCSKGFLILDLGFAVILATTIAVSLSYLLMRLAVERWWLLLFPIIYMLFDLTENTRALLGIGDGCEGDGYITCLKFVFIGISLLCTIYLLIVFFLRTRHES